MPAKDKRLTAVAYFNARHTQVGAVHRYYVNSKQLRGTSSAPLHDDVSRQQTDFNPHVDVCRK